MRKILIFSLLLCLIIGAFAACDTGNGDATTNGSSSETEEIGSSEKPADSESKVESSATESQQKDTSATEESSDSESASESTSESTSESESAETTPDDPWADIEAGIPSYVEDIAYTTADGYLFKQYDAMYIEDYYAAYKYYLEEGYTLYSENKVGEAVSATFVDGDAYVVLMLNSNKDELYIGECESGAENLPEFGAEYDRVCDVTVTQRYSSKNNGMCYFVRLEDGSFIIFDGGWADDTDQSYETLVKLNGSAENIHIRAWFITHSHGDHYQMYEQFSKDYADKVTLDTVYFCAVEGEVDGDTYMDSFLNKRVYTCLESFDGAKVMQVHTGMRFDMAGVKIEILNSPEHIYKDNPENDYFNETSITVRISNDEGSIIITGDTGAIGCRFMVDCYGEGLKSNMVQMAHHGFENSIPDFYDLVEPSVAFFPTNPTLYGDGFAKQHVLSSDYLVEIYTQGYGNVTKPLSYNPTEKQDSLELVEGKQMLMANLVKGNGYIKDLDLSNGTIKYTVGGSGKDVDANFVYKISNKVGLDASKHNAIKIVMKANEIQEDVYGAGGKLYYSVGGSNYDEEHSFEFYRQGFASEEGKYTCYIYLDNLPDYSGGRITELRFDIGATAGSEIEIFSIEFFHIDLE